MSLLDKIAGKFGYAKKRRPTHKRSVSGTGFAGGDMGRLWADWQTSPMSQNEKIRRDLVRMRTRCRNLYTDDDYAKRFVRLCKTNVVGSSGVSIKLDVRTGDTKDKIVCGAIEEAWAEWGKRKNCSASTTIDWLQAQNLVMGTLPTDGEFLVRKLKGFDNPFKFAIEFLPTDILDELKTDNLPNGSTVRMGVERDAYFKPVAYWLRTYDPSDAFMMSSYQYRSERVDAADIIHGFVPTSVNQVRGFPWFHSAMRGIKMLNGYEEAGLVAARESACKMGFLTQSVDANAPYTGDATDTGNPISEMEPGIIETLPPGYGYQSHDPTWPHQDHGAYAKAILRRIASGLDVSYNSLANDLEGVNYSSIRAGLLDERDMWMSLQSWFVGAFVQQIFEAWLEMALLSGAIKAPNGKSFPASKFDQFNAPKFNGRRWPWVDPKTDVIASIMAIEAGVSTRTDVIAGHGGDIDEVFETLKHEEALAKLNG